MSDTFSESATWSTNITRKETTDDVLGGPSGVANAAEGALANRTRWLRNQMAGLGLDVDWTEVDYFSTTAGTTFAVPAAVDEIFVLEGRGPGGGGAGGWVETTGGQGHTGGGGGEGAPAPPMFRIATTPEENLTIVIPAGGAGGTGLSADNYAATVLGADGAGSVQIKRGATVLLDLAPGKGGGISSSNPNSPGDNQTGQTLGGLGGSSTIAGTTFRGQPGRDGEAGGARKAGSGGGQGGGQGGAVLVSGGSRAATAGVKGGGGGGATGTNNGAAGGDGYLRIGYWTHALTGLPTTAP